MALYWLNFVHSDPHADPNYLGAAILEAPTLQAAIEAAHKTGIYPGRQVEGHEILPDRPTPPQEFIGRFLTMDEAVELDLSLTIQPPEQE